MTDRLHLPAVVQREIALRGAAVEAKLPPEPVAPIPPEGIAGVATGRQEPLGIACRDCGVRNQSLHVLFRNGTDTVEALCTPCLRVLLARVEKPEPPTPVPCPPECPCGGRGYVCLECQGGSDPEYHTCSYKAPPCPWAALRRMEAERDRLRERLVEEVARRLWAERTLKTPDAKGRVWSELPDDQRIVWAVEARLVLGIKEPKVTPVGASPPGRPSDSLPSAGVIIATRVPAFDCPHCKKIVGLVGIRFIRVAGLLVSDNGGVECGACSKWIGTLSYKSGFPGAVGEPAPESPAAPPVKARRSPCLHRCECGKPCDRLDIHTPNGAHRCSDHFSDATRSRQPAPTPPPVGPDLLTLLKDAEALLFPCGAVPLTTLARLRAAIAAEESRRAGAVVAAPAEKPCPRCLGGRVMLSPTASFIYCPTCNGTGKVPHDSGSAQGAIEGGALPVGNQPDGWTERTARGNCGQTSTGDSRQETPPPSAKPRADPLASEPGKGGKRRPDTTTPAPGASSVGEAVPPPKDTGASEDRKPSESVRFRCPHGLVAIVPHGFTPPPEWCEGPWEKVPLPARESPGGEGGDG